MTPTCPLGCGKQGLERRFTKAGQPYLVEIHVIPHAAICKARPRKVLASTSATASRERRLGKGKTADPIVAVRKHLFGDRALTAEDEKLLALIEKEGAP